MIDPFRDCAHFSANLGRLDRKRFGLAHDRNQIAPLSGVDFLGTSLTNEEVGVNPRLVLVHVRWWSPNGAILGDL